MAKLTDLYRASPCPDVLWFCEVHIGGPAIPTPFAFGTAYLAGGGIRRLDTSAPSFTYRADFSDEAASVSAVTFAVDPDDYDVIRSLRDGYWEGAKAIFYVGLAGWRREDYARAFTGAVDSIQWTPKQATIAFRAVISGLKKSAREAQYAGDGTTWEGGESLRGNKKRLGFGLVLNETPDLVNYGALVFSYSQGRSLGCFAVYDNAIPLEKGPDIGPLEDPATIDPPQDGYFRDQPSRSCIVLGAPPTDTSRITCSFRGCDDFGGYSETTAGIILQMFRAAGYTLSDLDTASYQRLAALYPYTVGIPVEDETWQSAIGRLMRGAYGSFGTNAEGLFEFWLYRTRPTQADTFIPAANIIPELERAANLPPVDTVIINGARNNTVQTQIAKGADPEHAAFVSKPFRPYGPKAQALSDAFEDAQSVSIDTFMACMGDGANDAQLFYSDVASTFLGVRAPFSLTVGCMNFRIRRGSTVEVERCVEADILGLSGAPLYVEEVVEILASKQTRLTLTKTIPVR